MYVGACAQGHNMTEQQHDECKLERVILKI
ncbi:Uncharacterised protein [Pseudomonas putida]|nr:Uncharacterised protein [Pseudomonas putida]